MIIFLDDLLNEKEAKNAIKLLKYNYDDDKISYLMDYHTYCLNNVINHYFQVIPMIFIYERFLRSSKSINDFLNEEQSLIISTLSILDINAAQYYETVCQILEDPFLLTLLISIYEFEGKK